MASIQRRGESSWLLVVEAGYNPDGKRIRRTKTIRVEDKALLRTTKRLQNHLEVELAKFQMEVESGEYIAPEKMLLKEFVKEWEKKYAEKELSETTLTTYLTHIKNHIIPTIGHLSISAIKPIHIINMINNAKRIDGSKEPLSVYTLQDIYLSIRNVMQRAVDWQIIKENPVAKVNKPKVRNQIKEDANVYSEEEVELLLETVQNEPPHWQVFLTLALAAGLRRSELLGLEWKHVDLEKKSLTINQVIVMGKDGHPVIKPPKSRRSRRVISLPDSIVQELEDYKKHWKKELMRTRNRRKTEQEFLFCNIDGTHFYPTTPTTWWRRFISENEIRHIRLHDLRHTAATLLINQGVHAKVISERLGHADIRITMDTYGHALQSADQGAAEKINDLFIRKSN